MTDSASSGTPPTLTLYNSLGRDRNVFTPASGNKVTMYVCGPTVYDDPHLGHARCYMTWDVLYRYLQFLGYEVEYARNVTDVDDKILQRAAERGQSPSELAEHYYQVFVEQMDSLNLLHPVHEPRATAYIDSMVKLTQTLIDKGAAYATPEGTVYYRVNSKADYGKLSGKPLDELRSGARVSVDPHKENPLDFALWKHANPEEGTTWPSPWGQGRPGWHTECTAMIHGIFGDTIDIHCGGADLVFPHHENEIAQGESCTGHVPFVRYWLHNGFVNVSGEKMSKSLGNFSTIAQVVNRYTANAIRYFILTNHYRMPVDFQDEALTAAVNRMVKVQRTLRQGLDKLGWDVDTWLQYRKATAQDLQGWIQEQEAQSSLAQSWQQWQTAMLDDLNTPVALAQVNDLLGEVNRLRVAGETSALEGVMVLLASLLTMMGFDLHALAAPEATADWDEATLQGLQALVRQWMPEQEASHILGRQESAAWVEGLLAYRLAVKAEKNWAAADGIRNGLTDLGFQLQDEKNGPTRWDYRPTSSAVSGAS